MLDKEFVNLGVYSIYDESLEKFGFPFVAENDAVALKRCASDFIPFDDVVVSDLKVFEVGQFDPTTGLIEGYSKDSIHLVFTGVDILSKIKFFRGKIKEAEEFAENDIRELLKLKESKEAK